MKQIILTILITLSAQSFGWCYGMCHWTEYQWCANGSSLSTCEYNMVNNLPVSSDDRVFSELGDSVNEINLKCIKHCFEGNIRSGRGCVALDAYCD